MIADPSVKSASVGFSIAEPFLRMRSAVIVLLDTQGRVIRASRGFERILDVGPGTAPDALNMRGLLVLPHFDDLVALPAVTPSTPVFEGILTLGGLEKPNRSIQGAVYRAGDQLLLVGEHDIGELERVSATVLQLNEELAEAEREVVRKNRLLEQLSRTDHLTGVANRRELEQRLQLECERCQRHGYPLSAIMGDIDFFKQVNDSYGHASGDRVLKRFAELLQTHSRQYDVVARLGGEEFVVLLPETPLATAVEVAERMRAALAKTTIPPLPQPITASFGVAELVSNESPETLLYRTDQALYEAKISGRNRVVRVD